MNDDDLVSITRADLRMLVDRASDDCGWPGREWQSDHQAVRIFAALNGPAAIRAVAESDTELVISRDLCEAVRVVDAGSTQLPTGMSIDFREVALADLVPGTHAPTPDQLFDAFWSFYPIKSGKKPARKAWDKAMKAGHNPVEIILGAERYAAFLKTTDTRPKYAQGWLNDERWTDDLSSITPTGQSKTTQNRANLTTAAREQMAGKALSFAERMELAGEQPQREIGGGR